jgi:saxitoxin biosynthesis operon SxtJ-like protein
MKSALPSNRSFGWTFTAVFVAGGLYSAWRGGPWMGALLALALATAAVTITRERWLTPLNRAWMKLGELMGRVVSPVVLGAIFFGVFTPAAAIMRLAKRDAMCRRFDAAARSYWVKRDPPGPAETSFRDLF